MKKHWTKSLKFKRFIQFRSFVNKLVSAAEQRFNDEIKRERAKVSEALAQQDLAAPVKVIGHLNCGEHAKPVLDVLRADGTHIQTDIDIARK